MKFKHHSFSAKKERLLLLFLVLFIYVAEISNSITKQLFPVDDSPEMDFVRDSPLFSLLSGQDAFGYYRPVKNLLWSLFSMLVPLGVEWFHVIAIAFGVLSFFPVASLCRRIVGSDGKALAAASIWLLSPTLVSSVAWLSCLNIQIMTAFASLAIVFHDKAWDNDSFHLKWIVFAGGFLLLSLLSYECAIAAVPILLLFDFILRPGRLSDARARAAHVAYWTIAVVYLVARGLFSARASTRGLWIEAERWQIVVTSPWFTAQHFLSWFWPFGRFTVLGGYRWGEVSAWTLASCATIGLIALASAALFCKKYSVISFCTFFSIFAFAPVSNCLGSGNGPYGDYYLTLASIGLSTGCVEIASLAATIRGRWRVAVWTVVFLFAATRIAAVAESARWAQLWSDGVSAYEESSRNYPDLVSNKFFVLDMLGNAGHYAEALRICEEIDMALPSDSRKMLAVYRLKALYALNVEKEPEKAIDLLDKYSSLARTATETGLAHYYRGCVFEDLKGNETAARTEYETALQGKWGIDFVQCADRLARLKALQGERKGAIALWEHALAMDPDNVSLLWNLSVACSEEGQDERCVHLREKVRRLTQPKRTPETTEKKP